MKSPSTLLFIALAATVFSSTQGWSHSAVEAVPKTEQWWQDRHKGFNARVAELGKKAQVLFIGDSITQGWEGEGKEVWARYYGHRNAINLGIGGDRTQHVLWRLLNGNLEGVAPKAVVVMIGTNNSNGDDNTPGQIVDGVGAIIAQLRGKLPDTKILLLAIFPRSENYSAQRGKIAQINQVLHRYTNEENTFWIDFGHRLLEDDGTIPRDLMPDYLHLSAKGYALWAEAIEEKLASILGDARVEPAGKTAGLTGDWTWSMATPDGQTVSAPLILSEESGKVTGKFSRSPGAWLEIENGKVKGNEFEWIVKRERPDGTTMTYHMSGRVEGNQIAGKTKTEVDGNEVTSDWSAKRP